MSNNLVWVNLFFSSQQGQTGISVQVQTARLLKIKCVQVKAHALYHACKAKRDGLQDRCKGCRAELDKLRLEHARSNSITTSTGAGSALASSHPRSAGLTRSGSTPTSNVNSAGSPKRRPMRSGSSSGHQALSPSISCDAKAAGAAADAATTINAAATAAVMAASRDDRPLKRRRYPNWPDEPAELKDEGPPPAQPLPQLLKGVPRYFQTCISRKPP